MPTRFSVCFSLRIFDTECAIFVCFPIYLLFIIYYFDFIYVLFSRFSVIYFAVAPRDLSSIPTCFRAERELFWPVRIEFNFSTTCHSKRRREKKKTMPKTAAAAQRGARHTHTHTHRLWLAEAVRLTPLNSDFYLFGYVTRCLSTLIFFGKYHNIYKGIYI